MASTHLTASTYPLRTLFNNFFLSQRPMVRRSSYFDPKAIDKKMSEFTTKESR